MIRQFLRINTAIGISLNIQSTGSFLLQACQVTREGKQLGFDEKITHLRAFDELPGKLSNKTPVSFNITGKGVLTKQVEKLTEITATNFAHLLPNANFEDFYVQNFISGEHSFVSMIRKTDVDHWTTQLTALGYKTVMLSLGPFCTENMLPQLNFYDEEIVFDGHLIRRNEQKEWTRYQYQEALPAPFVLKIESEKIDEKLLIAYASAFQLVMSDSLVPVQVSAPPIDTNRKAVLSTLWLKTYGTVVLIITFILLLINYLLLTHYTGENARLAEQVSHFTESTSDINAIKAQIHRKEAKLKILGWDGGVYKASLIDQLATDLPDEVTWKEVTMNPADQTASRIQKTMIFKDRQIRITGMSRQIIPVNEWMARIKIKPWVKTVQLESYAFNSELNTGLFTLTVTY